MPCLLGGVRVAARTADGPIVQARIPVALDLRAVVFVPEERVPTAHARGVLPVSVPLADALFNVARASMFVAALAAGRADLLAEATRDRLHQPYRLPLFPAGTPLLEAALRAGALGAFTSGAGPAVLALCADDAQAVGVEQAFEATAQHLGTAGEVVRLDLVERGAHLVR